MTVAEHLSKQDPARVSLLTELHELILKNDTAVIATVGPMMGKEMILYNDRGHFKYGLASVKDHMSLHLLPMYMNAPLYDKYVKELPDAKFQKGCINFKNSSEVLIDIVTRLIADCAPVDLIAMRQKQLDSKKKK